MNRTVLLGLTAAACGALGCGVGAGGAAGPLTARVTVSVNPVRLTQVPDIPSVPGARVDVDTIRATLDGQGDWVESERYGVVWVPGPQAVGAGEFVPYGSNGQWALTDAGWYWRSGYSWGWLTFHYGRWVMLERSWAWVPGALFAPAWVDWRVGNGWVGWAALPPRGEAFSAPYAFCHAGALAGPGLWGRVVYGTAGASVYPTTRALAPAYGLGGATYAWGPTPTGSAVPAVPVASVWRGETGARVGAPASGGAGDTVAARPAGVTPELTTSTARMPAMEHPAAVAGVDPVPATPGRPPVALPTATASAAVAAAAVEHPWPTERFAETPRAAARPVDPVAAAPGAVQRPYDPASFPVESYPNISGTQYGRAANTVVIPASIAAMRPTISLGTSESYGASSYNGTSVAAPAAYGSPSAPRYDASSYGPGPGVAYRAPAPSSAGAYAGPVYTPPTYNAAPAYNPGYNPGPAYNPGYNPAPAYNPPAASAIPSGAWGGNYAGARAPAYSAPVSVPQQVYQPPAYNPPAAAYRSAVPVAAPPSAGALPVFSGQRGGFAAPMAMPFRR